MSAAPGRSTTLAATATSTTLGQKVQKAKSDVSFERTWAWTPEDEANLNSKRPLHTVMFREMQQPRRTMHRFIEGCVDHIQQEQQRTEQLSLAYFTGLKKEADEEYGSDESDKCELKEAPTLGSEYNPLE